MSASVGTMRAGSNKHSGPKEKMTKNERNTQNHQQIVSKTEMQSNKMQPTQEQLRLAHDLMSTRQMDADPETVKELMAMTGKSEDVVVIALHDAGNDADSAVLMLLEGGDDQGEWREQGGKKKKKSNTTSQKEALNHINDGNHFDGRQKDRGDREDNKDRDISDRNDLPPRRGRRNGGPPPRLSRGRGRDRGNFGDRDSRDRNNVEDWDNERDDRRDRSGSDRGRSRGRGGFGGRRGGGGGRGRFNNSNDRDNRSYNRVPRFEKMNNSQPSDGPEIDTWTNETAVAPSNNKDTDWNNWNDTWVNEEDQWTGTLDETKVFTPSQMKMSDPDPVLAEPPSPLGQRLDVGSLFSESAKFSKAPDYSKPTGDAYINQFNQAATESIKNTIGIGSSSRPPQSLSSIAMPQPVSPTNSLGLSSLAPAAPGGQAGSSMLSSLAQQGQQQQQTNDSLASSLTQLQMGSMSSAHQGQMAAMASQGSREPASQSRLPPVAQSQQGIGQVNNLQQRPKPQRSKLPPPSRIPSTAVEMPGHIPQNPQLDLQFGIDFGSDSGSSSFGFGGSTVENAVSTSSYSSTNGSSSVISNHLPPTIVSEGSNSSVSNIMSSPSAGSTKVPSNLESSRQATVFHNSVYNSSPPKNEAPSLERDQKISGQDNIPFPSSQVERKSSPLMPSQHPGQNQNLNSGGMTHTKSDSSSNNIGTNYSATNGYSSSFPSHQKSTSMSSQSQFTHTASSQGSSFPGQYPPSQSTYPSAGQGQFNSSSSSSQYPPPSGQPPQFNTAQSQYSSQNYSGSSGSQHPSMSGLSNHPNQYSSNTQNAYSSSTQSQYQSYQGSSSSFPSHPPSQTNYPSSGQSSGSVSSMYPTSSQSNAYTSQSNSYQSPSAGSSSYHSRDSQVASTTVSTQSSGVSFPSPAQSSSLKTGNSQTGSNYNSQSYNSTPAPLQPSSLANKLGESLSKMTLKDTATLDGHQSTQFEHTSSATTTGLTSTSSTVASLSTGTSTISSTSTASSITSTSRIATMPSTSKAPPLPPGVPLMGQYIMGQSTMPPFYSVQPPMYGYDDVQLLAQQRMPLQAGSYYDMGAAFPAPAGSTLPTGRDQQPPIPSVSFPGTPADSTKMPRVDAQSPSSVAQPQSAHSAGQQPSLINFHYGYYYPSVFPGAAGLQYPMFPIPPVTNAAAHAGTTATTQFQKNFPSHVYSGKGYDELNQAQDFSKTGYGSTPSTGKTSGTRMSTRTGNTDMAPNAYKSHNQPAFDKSGFHHGSTPPPFNLNMASASQTGPMGAPANPYGAPFLPMVAHNQMMHHQLQQDSNSSAAASRGMSQAGSQSKPAGNKSYGGPAGGYWNS